MNFDFYLGILQEFQTSLRFNRTLNHLTIFFSFFLFISLRQRKF
jgi:hypothetical protein